MSCRVPLAVLALFYTAAAQAQPLAFPPTPGDVYRQVLTGVPTASPAEIKEWFVISSTTGLAGNQFFGTESIGLAPATNACLLEGFYEYYPIEVIEGSYISGHHPPPAPPRYTNPATTVAPEVRDGVLRHTGYGTKATVYGPLTKLERTGTPGWDPTWPGTPEPSWDPIYLPDDPQEWVHTALFCDKDYDMDLFPSSWHGRRMHVEIDAPIGHILSVLAFHPGTIVCAYGPAIMDDNTCGSPVTGGPINAHEEIHPAEQIWWGDAHGATLVSSADYSGRFDADLHFLFEGICAQKPLAIEGASYTGPWVRVPLQSSYAIPFKCGPGEAIRWYGLFDLGSEHTPPRAAAGVRRSPGTELHLSQDGADQPLVRVYNFSDYATIGFEKVRKRDDGTIQGYITIKTAVGQSGMTGGYAAFRWVEGHPPVEFNVELLSVARITKNSYDRPQGAIDGPARNSRIAALPYSIESPGGDYDEDFVRLLMRAPGRGKEEVDLNLRVGEARHVGLRVVGYESPWNSGAIGTILFLAQDARGNNIGEAFGGFEKSDYGGRVLSDTIKKAYPYPLPPIPGGAEPVGPGPGERQGTLEYEPAERRWGRAPDIREMGSVVVDKFAVTYRVTRGNKERLNVQYPPPTSTAPEGPAGTPEGVMTPPRKKPFPTPPGLLQPYPPPTSTAPERPAGTPEEVKTPPRKKPFPTPPGLLQPSTRGQPCDIDGRVSGPYFRQVRLLIYGPNDANRLATTALPAADGTFRARGLQPGTYSIVPRPTGGIRLKVEPAAFRTDCTQAVTANFVTSVVRVREP